MVKDGNLTLRITDDGDGTYTKPYDVVSKDTMAFKYGYLEIRAQVPYRKGLFPAFWLTPAQDLKESEYNGEVDIFEVFGSTDTSTTTMHIWDQDWNLIKSSYESSNKREHTFSWFETTFGGVKAEGWHTYGFEWTESYMKFYVDGDCYYTADITDSNASNWGVDTLDCFRDYYTIILNNGLYEDTVKKNGLGSSYVDFNIDYVRLYQLQNGEYINNYEF
jgi:beta-glucanase (GH16 family)